MLFFDMVRNLAMLSVVLYHAAGAYSTVAPYWPVHDGSSVIADGIRELFDVFMMPVFFFLAGYFALPSLYKQGTRRFLTGKFRRLGVSWLLALFVIIPMTLHFTRMKANPDLVHQPFWQYWMTYLSDFAFLVPFAAPHLLHRLRHFPRREKQNAWTLLRCIPNQGAWIEEVYLEGFPLGSNYGFSRLFRRHPHDPRYVVDNR
jgi:surface polysaccharide O-acyltransferase-like enzyme